MPIFIYVEEFNGIDWEIESELSIQISTERNYILFEGIAATRKELPGNASLPILAEQSHTFLNSMNRRPYKKIYGHLYIEEIKNIAATELLKGNNKRVKAATEILKLLPKNSRGNHRIIYYHSGIG